mmetsp:Transcript_12393/g.43142  ORF Transcript_12393/g.43142 Transcript_12393/m.43142 type:complete len:82 (+) Transcript_12393:471-716(+)
MKYIPIAGFATSSFEHDEKCHLGADLDKTSQYITLQVHKYKLKEVSCVELRLEVMLERHVQASHVMPSALPDQTCNCGPVP